ncbi:GIY-YIG nuclease family protein [Thermoactinomyces sp. CICC 10521]|uniref:GIY-YIG nuclease family protein n=1 Tax=Thermoactinomyces sp. CICC 10521 TaxID=2767426 RepID=UPI0018DE68F5|nr:GIY-YIG nuclease family protein [Thermoactinomyces sp. CICC 10521]MBH8608930.1 GIY-YIG nuclease family protein [Thermoactinomyces sp. CICC 10521]
MMGIYAIENIITKECYVGQSKNIVIRYQQHINMLEKGEHHSHKLQNAFNHMGIQSFALKILELCDEDQLDIKEQEWINRLNSIEAGYNVKSNGMIDQIILTKVKNKWGVFIPLSPLTEEELNMIRENEQLMHQIGGLVRSAILINHSLEKSHTYHKVENKSTIPSEKVLSKKELRKKEIRRVKRWLKNYYKRTGKIPGRKKIEIGAKCKQSVARAALAKFKEELSSKKL